MSYQTTSNRQMPLCAGNFPGAHSSEKNTECLPNSGPIDLPINSIHVFRRFLISVSSSNSQRQTLPFIIADTMSIAEFHPYADSDIVKVNISKPTSVMLGGLCW